MWILTLILGAIAFFLVAVMFIAELIKVRKALEHIAYSDRFQILAKVDAGLMRENAAVEREVPLRDAGSTDLRERLRSREEMTGDNGYHESTIDADRPHSPGEIPKPESESEPEPEPEPEVHEYHKTKINVIAEEE